jgi:predicted permease
VTVDSQLKQVIRRLGRSPMFAVVTLVTIGIGAGANSAIFSVIHGVLLEPLTYTDSERLVDVSQSAPAIGFPNCPLSPSDYFSFHDDNRTFQQFGIWTGDTVSVTGLGAPEQVQALLVSEGTLNALGVQPILGRWFTPKDDAPGSPEPVILVYGYWQRRFGGDRSVIGRQIRLDGTPKEIIGLMPQSFRFLDMKPELIQPFRFDRAKTTLGNFSYQGIARLKPGVSLAQANTDVGRMIPLVNRRFPPPPGFTAKIFADLKIFPKVQPLKQSVVGDLGKVLWVLMASIGVVLLIACANVANLLLVRADGRRQEIAVRAAIGASTSQIAGELLIESTLLGLLGGVVGLVLAYGALRLLVNMAAANLPRIENITINPAVLLFTLVVSLAAGFLFGLIPVLKYAMPNVTPELRAGGRTLSQSREAQRTRSALVVLQVGLAVVLLIGSGLMIRTFQSLRRVQPGFQNAHELQAVHIYVPETQVKEPDQVIAMFREMERKLGGIPGVRSVAMANSVPTDGNTSTDLLYAEDKIYREGQLPPLRRFKFVAPGFFETMGTPLIAGRDFNWTEITARRPVAMVSENMAREMWNDPRSALGKRIREGMNDPWREIVGVVGDVHSDGPDKKASTTIYWPVLLNNLYGNDVYLQRGVTFAIRSSRAGSESFLKEVREAIWSVNRDLPLAQIQTLEQIYRGSMARSSFTLVMIAIAGGMALLLGVVGIYGVISYSVSQRTREIGIRIALGAQRTSLQVMVVRNGVLLAAVGVAAGLLGAAGLTRFLSSFLYAVSPLDPVTYCAVAIGLLAAAAAASYVPAHRASTVNPVDALRAE